MVVDQIRRLFDSLVRGYPIGSFLFWEVAQRRGEIPVLRLPHGLPPAQPPYAPQVSIPAGQGVTAILDGQQRLTAVNIGLYGSHAERQARSGLRIPTRTQEAAVPGHRAGGPR